MARTSLLPKIRSWPNGQAENKGRGFGLALLGIENLAARVVDSVLVLPEVDFGRFRDILA